MKHTVFTNTIKNKNMMSKKTIALFISLFITVTTFAQAPDMMSYQAVIRNSSNALVTNQAIGMRISILQTSAIGTAVYVETQVPISNSNGLITITIGGGYVGYRNLFRH